MTLFRYFVYDYKAYFMMSIVAQRSDVAHEPLVTKY